MQPLRGRLTVITAPTMFAGKSERANALCNHAQRRKKRVLRITHSHDVRPHDTDTTAMRHSGERTAHVRRYFSLAAITTELVNETDLFWIDEGQFFADLIPHVQRFLAAGKNVIVSGLYLDSGGRPWGDVMRLAACEPLHEFVLLHADCTQCGAEEAAMHCPRRAVGDDVVMVGGADMYDALCEDCFRKLGV